MERYNSRNQRVASFNEVPNSLRRRAAQFIREGFFYIPPLDVVQCHVCTLTITEWKLRFNIKHYHKIMAPSCTSPYITVHHRPTIQLCHMITKTTGKWTARHYFQAMFRLQFYKNYPLSPATDIFIDTHSTNIWQNFLSNQQLTIFRGIRKKITTSTLLPAHHPSRTPNNQHTPFECFTTAVWKSHPGLSHILHYTTSASQLHEIWTNSSYVDKQEFIDRAVVNKKRDTAQLIESTLRHQGLWVGTAKNGGFIIGPYTSPAKDSPTSIDLDFFSASLIRQYHGEE